MAPLQTWPGTCEMLKSNPNSPTFVFDDLPLHWQMTRCEKFALGSLLTHIDPETSIEVGTYKGGSLQVISDSSAEVYSIDINPCDDSITSKFNNVRFLTGPSKEILPDLLKRIYEFNQHLQFVLIDGDHSTEGVRGDINAVLQYHPSSPLYVVLHDSFHPPCRQGMLTASWQECPWVHYVEIDFIPGVYHHEAFDTAAPRSMYGGLAVAVLKPELRKGELVIHQSQRGLYDMVRKNSNN